MLEKLTVLLWGSDSHSPTGLLPTLGFCLATGGSNKTSGVVWPMEGEHFTVLLGGFGKFSVGFEVVGGLKGVWVDFGRF